MNKGIQIEQELNRLVNTVTCQNDTRMKHLVKHPLCVFFGSIPEEIREMLHTELTVRLGSERATEFIMVQEPEKIEEATVEALHQYQEKVENGAISQQHNSLFVPILFMADQIRAEELEKSLGSLECTMRRFGFKEDYQICYYCLFDYEEMDGSICKMQLEHLLQGTRSIYPLGLFTQSNMSRTVRQKYLKAVQAIAMHIFLQVSRDKIGEKITNRMFTLGHWRLDILKQKMADYLIQCIENQERQLVTEEKYMDYLKEALEETTDFQIERYIKSFMKAPVNYSGLESLLPHGVFRTGKAYSVENIMGTLYGDSQAFTKFMQINLPEIEESELRTEFMKRNIGNCYMVQHKMEEALSNLSQIYEQEKERKLIIKENKSKTIWIQKSSRAENIIEQLANQFWNNEGELFRLDRRISFISSIKKYIKTEEFTRKLEEYSKRNQEYLNQLKSIRREASGSDESILMQVNEETEMHNVRRLPRWNQDLLAEGPLSGIQTDIMIVKEETGKWVGEHLKELLAGFVRSLGNLKRIDEMGNYYAARLDIPRNAMQMEILYLGELADRQNNFTDTITEMLQRELPRLIVKECNWETNMCFELFTLREIKDLAEIYAID